MNSEDGIYANPLTIKDLLTKIDEWDGKPLKGHIQNIRTLHYVVSNDDGTGEKQLLLASFVKNYNELGQLISAFSLNKDGSPIWEYVYHIKNLNKEIECICYNADHELEERIIFGYDDKSNLINKTCLDGNGKLNWEIRFQYNDKGVLLMKEFYSDTQKQIHKYHGFCYDNKGYLIRMFDSPNVQHGEGLPDHFFDFKISYQYDEQGEIVERCETSPSGQERITFYNYNYDRSGNWTEKREYLAPLKILTAITERIIEYYHD